VTDTTETQSSPSEDGDDNQPDRLAPLTGSLSADTGQQMMAARLAEVRAIKKDLEKEEKRLTGELKPAMIAAGAATLTGENGVVVARITMFDRTTVDAKALEVKHPLIYDECSKVNQVVQIRTA